MLRYGFLAFPGTPVAPETDGAALMMLRAWSFSEKLQVVLGGRSTPAFRNFSIGVSAHPAQLSGEIPLL
jgi:hypothetical protein